MTTPFQFTDFGRVARALAQNGGEAELRIAVGRLYYALFHVAKQRLGVSGKDIHRQVVLAVKKRDAAAGNQLDSLKRLRIAADYDQVVRPAGNLTTDWQQNWNTAQTIATSILPRIQRLTK